jgi:hypothetical protein
MNARERMIAALTFGTPDKIPFGPGGGRESTKAKWRTQGLPEDADPTSHVCELLGIERELRTPDVGLDLPWDCFKMKPQFEEKVLEHRDGHYLVQDWMGNITEISDTYDYTYIRNAKDFVTRKWHDAPAHNRDEWEERVAWRYDVDDPTRLPADFLERAAALKERSFPLSIAIPGPFWQMREWVGFEGLCYLMADDPEFVHAMAQCNLEFILRMLDRITQHVELDQVTVAEDMAYKAHAMISPAMTREFVIPAYRAWGDLLHDRGCPVFTVDSDGNIATLLPLWVEAGVDCAAPMEVAAGKDLAAYRQRYGTQMAFRGGIDKRAIAVGGDVMREEVMSTITPMIELGGFIPGCDHGIPPDVSWPNYVEYAKLLAKVTGWL